MNRSFTCVQSRPDHILGRGLKLQVFNQSERLGLKLLRFGPIRALDLPRRFPRFLTRERPLVPPVAVRHGGAAIARTTAWVEASFSRLLSSAGKSSTLAVDFPVAVREFPRLSGFTGLGGCRPSYWPV